MILNFFKVAFRNMMKYKSYSFINVIGLSIGMACVILIFLFVRNEQSYDTFYPNSQSVYRLANKAKMGEQVYNSTLMCAPIGPAMVADFPQVVDAVRFYIEEDYLVGRGERQFVEDRVILADSSFFKVFPVPFLNGNAETALNGTRSLVLSSTMAQKYFGEEDPVGKMLKLNGDEEYTVTGVFEDLPDNTHFHFNFVIPLLVDANHENHWFTQYLYTYLLLEEGVDYKDVEAMFQDFIVRHVGPRVKELLGIDLDAWEESGNEYAFYLEPEEWIYLHSKADYQIEAVSSVRTIQIISIIAFFILLLACVNFLNLTTARSYTRAREVGVRKVFGSSRVALIAQFLSETFLMTMFALALALLEVELFLPLFNQVSQKSLSFGLLLNVEALLFIIGVSLFVVFFAGSYTALSLSGFRLSSVLKGEVRTGRRGKRIRSALVIFQFAVAMVILVSALVIQTQVKYMQGKKLGFEKEQVLVVDRAHVLQEEQKRSIRQEFKRSPEIKNVAFTSHIPGRGANGWSMYPEGASNEEMVHFRTMYVDQEFLDVLGVKLKEGRSFSSDRLTDTATVVANQEAIRAMGYDHPVGRQVFAPGMTNDDTKTPLEIIGVMQDFHFESMRQEIAPLLLLYAPNMTNRYMMIKLAPGEIENGLNRVRQKWELLTHGQPFEYFFLDNDFNNLFKSEMRVSRILSIFTLLCFLIACLGLLGLVSFEMQQRVKEIGIRKVLGCSELNLIAILSRDMVGSVLAANVIAWPVTYFVMQKWLTDFAYRIGFPWYYFAIGLVLSILLAVAIVSSHSMKVVRDNPVDSLKYE
jgi:putative ABC transport system permease protein